MTEGFGGGRVAGFVGCEVTAGAMPVAGRSKGSRLLMKMTVTIATAKTELIALRERGSALGLEADAEVAGSVWARRIYVAGCRVDWIKLFYPASQVYFCHGRLSP